MEQPAAVLPAATLTTPDKSINEMPLAGAALLWAKHGWLVFPLVSESKMPYAKGAFCKRTDDHECGFRCASNDLNQIADWWQEHPASNIGITHPRGLVIDEDKLGAITKAGLQLPRCPYAITGRRDGGRHFFLRAPEGWPIDGVKVKSRLDDIDIKGFGRGYVVAAPSVHETGTIYAQKLGGYMPEASKALIAALTTTEKTPESAPALMTLSDYESEGYQLPPMGYAGARYDAIRDFAASRYNKLGGLSARDEVLASVLAVLAPRFANPLTEAEIRERFERVWSGIGASLGPPMVRTRAAGGSSEPLDIQMALPKPSIFPDPPSAEAFGQGVADMAVFSLASKTSASDVGMLMTLLTAWGGLFGTTCVYHGTQTSSFFGVLIGETGRGRKGTATRAVWSALESALRPPVAPSGVVQITVPLSAHRWDGAASGEALIRVLSDAKGSDPSSFVGGLVVEEEFENVLRKVRSSQNYASTLGTTLQKAFDGAMLQNLTKSMSQRVYAPYSVSILGNITVEVLRLLMPPELISGGFANRFLWTPVAERDVVISGTEEWRFHESVAGLLREARDRWAAGTREQTLTSSGWELLQEYSSFLQTMTGPYAKFVARLHVIALRAAMVHASLDQVDAIDDELVGRGIALTEYCRRGLVWAFSSKTGDDWVDALVMALDEARPGGLKGREVAKLLGNNAARIGRTRAMALEAGLITVEVDSSGSGRPSHVYKAASAEALWGFVRRGHAQVHIPLPATSTSPVPSDTTLSTNKPLIKGEYSVDIPLHTVEKGEDVHVECFFPAEHSTSWMSTPEGWVCSTCQK